MATQTQNAPTLASGKVLITELNVTTTALAASAVTAAKINTSAVTSGKIAASAVTTAKIAATAVTAAKIGTSAVTATKLARSSVTTVKIKAANITTTLLAASAVTEAKMKLADNTTFDVTTGRHGFVPKASGTATKYLRDDVTWAAPTAGLPDLVKTLKHTNGNQTILDEYSAIIVGIYTIDTNDLLDIQGTGILEVT